MITGSSALKIEKGRDSLAGRLSTIEMGPLFLREIASFRGFGDMSSFLAFNGLAQLKNKSFWQELRAFGEQHREIRRAAFAAFSERGAYPIAHVRADRPWEEIADQLNETVIRRVVQHDLRPGGKGRRRDAKLFEEVFRVGCRYIGQAPNAPLYYDEIKRAIGAEVSWSRILTYLDFLNESLLLRLIEPLELRLKRRQGAGKLCLCDHALRASWLQEVVLLTEDGLAGQPHLSDLAGRIAESAAGYFISSILSLDVAHFPERNLEPEVDFVLTVGEQRIPIEVKYRRRIDFNDTRGLRSFIEHSAYNAPFGLLITLTEYAEIDDPRIVQMPLSTLLLLR
jgi:predicted AAA+ superfamily ATPase